MKKKEKILDWMFIGKVLRNSFILGGLYIGSILLTSDICWENFKPILAFLILYFFTEMAGYYKINQNYKLKQKKVTLFF